MNWLGLGFVHGGIQLGPPPRQVGLILVSIFRANMPGPSLRFNPNGPNNNQRNSRPGVGVVFRHMGWIRGEFLIWKTNRTQAKLRTRAMINMHILDLNLYLRSTC